MRLHKSIIFLILSIIVLGFFNYNPQMLFRPTGYYHWGWQCALLASIGFILLIRFREKEKWKNLLGIDFNKKDFFVFFTLTFFFIFLSYWIMFYILKTKNVNIKILLFDYNQFDNFKGAPLHVILSSYLYYIPQTFNEEMIVGALLLNSLKNRFKKSNYFVISSIVALIFCLMHQVLYRFSPVQSGELLSITTLISLFLVGLIRNYLILRTGKIVYSWAIHLAWNLVFLTSFIVQTDGQFTTEPSKFNLILGDFRLMLFILLMTFFVIIWPRIIKLKNR